MIYEQCLKKKVNSSISKRAYVIPIHKKNSKQSTNSYLPTSVLPTFAKAFKKFIIFVYCHPCNNEILIPHQSSFILTEETRAVFLDLSKGIW